MLATNKSSMNFCEMGSSSLGPSTQKHRRKSSGGNRRKAQPADTSTAVKEACDAASCERAREKWLKLELQRQTQIADAQSEQLACTEQEKKQLEGRVRRLEAALAQHETFAQLEAQGAQQVEKEMAKLRAKLKQQKMEVFALRQFIQAADKKMQSEEKAEAVKKAAEDSAWEAHRQLLRKLFALVVRANMAVQTRNAAMQYAPPGSCTAGLDQCMDVLESLVSLRQTCAELLSSGGMSSDNLTDLGLMASASALPAMSTTSSSSSAAAAAAPAAATGARLSMAVAPASAAVSMTAMASASSMLPISTLQMPAECMNAMPMPESPTAVEVSLGGGCFQPVCPNNLVRSPWTSAGGCAGAAEGGGMMAQPQMTTRAATPRRRSQTAAGSSAGSMYAGSSCCGTPRDTPRGVSALGVSAAGSDRSRRVSFSSCNTPRSGRSTPRRSVAGPSAEPSVVTSDPYFDHSSQYGYGERMNSGYGGLSTPGSSMPSANGSAISACSAAQPALRRLRAMRTATASAAVNALFTGAENAPALPPGFGDSGDGCGSQCNSAAQTPRKCFSSAASVASMAESRVRRGRRTSHSHSNQHYVATAEHVVYPDCCQPLMRHSNSGCQQHHNTLLTPTADGILSQAPDGQQWW